MGPPIKVLVVDDENQILVLIKHALERAGFSVITLSDPTRAVATAARDLPQIIISDLMMPKIDGYGVLKALRANPLTAAIPVVFLSAAPPKENLPKAFAHGVVGYFEKPFHPARLGQQLKTLLSDLAQRKNEVHGSLRQTSLQLIVEMMARERRTGILQVKSGAFDCRVIFQLGEAKDAMVGSLRGEAAIEQLNTLKEGEFSLSGIDGAQADLVELSESDFVESEADEAIDIVDVDSIGGVELESATKVMVIDDESDIAKLIEKTFMASGYHVTTAPNGRDALKCAVALRPDVVICDIRMPEMDGWRFFHQLKADFRINEARFVFLSGYPDLEQRLRDVGVSADGYVAKGTMLTTLLQRIEQLIRPRRELYKRMQENMSEPYAGRVEPLGTKHVLRLLHTQHFSGTLTLENVWHKITCEFAFGQPAAVIDRGMVESSGPIAFAELCAQTAGEIAISPASAGLQANIDIPFDRLIQECESDLTRAEQRVVDANLVEATFVNVDEHILSFYFQLAPKRLMPVLEAVRAGKLPREVIASVDLPPTETEDVLRDLVRKRILSFDTLADVQP